ncbi:polysaccharide deacetylase family protein [Ferrimonas balearica]|uniref:polysaccharide deacetylase family protein n=1 Tax=Ferrimonas balearica TaxID=44012 RepID=UPI001C9855F1|nr:polysaccharide deacetylase family protein [Ferrimonas balearica]MBY5978953.1 polysaccharide deacetylase family protein [Ferrimonas balearica]
MINFIAELALKLKKRSCVLCFHSIGDKGYDAERFKALILKLKALGYRFPDPALIASGQAGQGDGEVYITFDDGYADNLDVIEQFLKPQGIKPIVFVVTGLLDGEIEDNAQAGLKAIPHFSYEACRAFRDDALFAYHTHRHDDLYQTSKAEIEPSLKHGFQRFRKELDFGQPIYFAYPFGYLPTEQAAFTELLTDLGVSHAFTTRWGKINPENPYFINRVVIGDNDSVARSLLKISGVLDGYARRKWSGERYGD